MTREARASVPLCPSAQPEWEGAVAIGVVGGTPEEPRLRPLARPLPVTKRLLALSEPVHPTEVFRFAAPCLCNGCSHFSDAKCGLVTNDALPAPDVRLAGDPRTPVPG